MWRRLVGVWGLILRTLFLFGIGIFGLSLPPDPLSSISKMVAALIMIIAAVWAFYEFGRRLVWWI
jgi:hypothetical protein